MLLDWMRPRALAGGLGLLLIPASPALVRAQTGELPDVTALRPAAPPAFVLLGAAATEIARPQSFSDLKAVVGNRLEQLSSVPQDLSTEVAPYWVLSRANLSWRADTTRSVLESVLRTFRLSIASARIGTRENPGTALATGISVDILSGEIADTAQKILAAIEQDAAAQGALFNRHRALGLAQLDAALATRLAAIRLLPASEQAAAVQQATREHQAAREALDAAVREDPGYQAELAKLRDKYQDFAITRRGWFWNVQAAMAWNFPGDTWVNGDFGKWGIWTTFSYDDPKLSRDFSISPLAVFRYVGSSTTDSLPDMVDVGARLIASASKYAASFEYVLRSPVGGGQDQHRLVGLLEYQLAGGSWLQASFGKGLKRDDGSDLIARLGVSLSLAKQRYRAE